MTGPPYPDRDGRAFLDLARDRLAVQIQQIVALDNKIAMLASLSTAMLGILGAALAVKAGSEGGAEWAMTGISSGTYALIVFHARRAYATKGWSYGSELADIRRSYVDADGDDKTLEWMIADDLSECYKENAPQLEAKLHDLDVILPAIVTQTLSLLVALLLAAA